MWPGRGRGSCAPSARDAPYDFEDVLNAVEVLGDRVEPRRLRGIAGLERRKYIAAVWRRAWRRRTQEGHLHTPEQPGGMAARGTGRSLARSRDVLPAFDRSASDRRNSSAHGASPDGRSTPSLPTPALTTHRPLRARNGAATGRSELHAHDLAVDHRRRPHCCLMVHYRMDRRASPRRVERSHRGVSAHDRRGQSRGERESGRRQYAAERAPAGRRSRQPGASRQPRGARSSAARAGPQQSLDARAPTRRRRGWRCSSSGAARLA